MGRIAALSALALLLVLAGCGDDTAATGPTSADLEAERARLAAQIKRSKGRKAAPAPSAAPAADGAAGANFASVGQDYEYDETGRRDPFQPYRVDTASIEDDIGGPLEQFELEQLAVVALVWEHNVPRAMVSDPSGTTYVVQVGSRMGKNEGRVIHIGDNLVLVKETYVDYAGEESTKDVELRIRRSQGG